MTPTLLNGDANVDGEFPVAIICNTCRAQGPVTYESDMDSDTPITQWNTRPAEDRLTKMVMDAEKRFR
jgi:hypothetical protein